MDSSPPRDMPNQNWPGDVVIQCELSDGFGALVFGHWVQRLTTVGVRIEPLIEPDVAREDLSEEERERRSRLWERDWEAEVRHSREVGNEIAEYQAECRAGRDPTQPLSPQTMAALQPLPPQETRTAQLSHGPDFHRWLSLIGAHTNHAFGFFTERETAVVSALNRARWAGLETLHIIPIRAPFAERLSAATLALSPTTIDDDALFVAALELGDRGPAQL